jgi:YfiR/HmsC-like
MGLLSGARALVADRAWRLGLVLRRSLALLFGIAFLMGAGAPVSEYQLKAVFLFNFAHFVEWPATALPGGNAPFVIGVVGKDPFGSSLDEVVRGESVGGRPLAIERYPDVPRLGKCQILFIPAPELTHLEQILEALKGRSVLTVTEGPAPRGAIVDLLKEDSRIRLRIDLQAARASNLTISSKLLRPAEIVDAGS